MDFCAATKLPQALCSQRQCKGMSHAGKETLALICMRLDVVRDLLKTQCVGPCSSQHFEQIVVAVLGQLSACKHCLMFRSCSTSPCFLAPTAPCWARGGQCHF